MLLLCCIADGVIDAEFMAGNRCLEGQRDESNLISRRVPVLGSVEELQRVGTLLQLKKTKLNLLSIIPLCPTGLPGSHRECQSEMWIQGVVFLLF